MACSVSVEWASLDVLALVVVYPCLCPVEGCGKKFVVGQAWMCLHWMVQGGTAMFLSSGVMLCCIVCVNKMGSACVVNTPASLF